MKQKMKTLFHSELCFSPWAEKYFTPGLILCLCKCSFALNYNQGIIIRWRVGCLRITVCTSTPVSCQIKCRTAALLRPSTGFISIAFCHFSPGIVWACSLWAHLDWFLSNCLFAFRPLKLCLHFWSFFIWHFSYPVQNKNRDFFFFFFSLPAARVQWLFSRGICTAANLPLSWSHPLPHFHRCNVWYADPLHLQWWDGQYPLRSASSSPFSKLRVEMSLLVSL